MASYQVLKAIVYAHMASSSSLKGQCISAWTHPQVLKTIVYAQPASYPRLKRPVYICLDSYQVLNASVCLPGFLSSCFKDHSVYPHSLLTQSLKGQCIPTWPLILKAIVYACLASYPQGHGVGYYIMITPTKIIHLRNI